MEANKPPMSLLCQIPASPGDFVGGGTVLCSFCKTRRVSSLEELKAHIAWEDLSYTPYQCIHCQHVNRPTDLAMKLHFRECHPGQPIKMIYSPVEQLDMTLQFEIDESLRQKGEEQCRSDTNPTHSAPSTRKEGSRMSPTPSSSSVCSEDMNGVTGDVGNSEKQTAFVDRPRIRPLPLSMPTRTITDVMETSKTRPHYCQMCKKDMTSPSWSKAKKHEHIIMHLRREGLNVNSDYGQIRARCFPSPESEKFRKKKCTGGKRLEVRLDRRDAERLQPALTENREEALESVLPPTELTKNPVKISSKLPETVQFLAEVAAENAVSAVKFPFVTESGKITPKGRFQGAKSMRVCLTGGKYQIGSKEILCYLCRGTVKASKVFEHVVKTHLEENSLKCRHCGLENRYDWQALKDHSKSAHSNLDVNIEDLTPKFGQEIEDLLKRCFPGSPAAELKGRFVTRITGTLTRSVTEMLEKEKNVVPEKTGSRGAESDLMTDKGDDNCSQLTENTETQIVVRRGRNEEMERGETGAEQKSKDVSSSLGSVPQSRLADQNRVQSTESDVAQLVNTDAVDMTLTTDLNRILTEGAADGLQEVFVAASQSPKEVTNNRDEKPVNIAAKLLTENEEFAQLSGQRITHCNSGKGLLSTEEEHSEKTEQISMPYFGEQIRDGKRQNREVPVVRIKEDEVLKRKAAPEHKGETKKTSADQPEHHKETEAAVTARKTRSMSIDPRMGDGEPVKSRSAPQSEVLPRKGKRWFSDRKERSETPPSSGHAETNSATKRPAACQLCGSSVPSSSRHTHVVQCHLKEPLFHCPYCDLSVWVSKGNLSGHIAKFHPDKEVVIWSTRDYFKERMAELRQSCFGMSVMAVDVNRREKSWGGRPHSTDVEIRQVTEEEVSTRPKESISKQGTGVSPVSSSPGTMQQSRLADKNPVQSTESDVTQLVNKEAEVDTPLTTDVERILDDDDVAEGVQDTSVATNQSSEELRNNRDKKAIEDATKILTENAECVQLIEDLPKMENVPENKQQADLSLLFLDRESSDSPELGDSSVADYSTSTPRGKLVECALCRTSVDKSMRNYHVVKCHLKKQLFYCPYCSKSEYFIFGNIRQHIANCHSDKELVVLSTEEEHSEKMEQLSMACFDKHIRDGKGRKRVVRVVQIKEDEVLTRKQAVPEHQKKMEAIPARKTKSMPFCTKLDDNLVKSRRKSRKEPEEMSDLVKSRRSARSEVLQRKVVEGSFSNQKERSETPGPTNGDACHLCGISVLSSSRYNHLVKCHLKKPLFHCPYCEAAEWVSKGYLSGHIAKTHPGKKVVIWSTKDYFKAKLDELKQRCFGILVTQGLSRRGRKPSMDTMVRQVTEEEVLTRKNQSVGKQELELSGSKQRLLKRKRNSVDSDASDEILGPSSVPIKPEVPEKTPRKMKMRESSGRNRELENIKEDLAASQLVKAETRLRRRESRPDYYIPDADENDDDDVCILPSKKLKMASSLPSRKQEPEVDWDQGQMKSKKQNKLTHKTCQMCRKQVVAVGHRMRHVMVNHLRKPIGLCLYCSYSCTGDFANMQKHIMSHHQGKPVTWTDKREDFQPEIKKLLGKCFPDKCFPLQCPKWKPVPKKQGVAQNRVLGKKFGLRKVSRPAAVTASDTVVCSMCNVKVQFQSRKRHVTSHHLGEPVFFCGYCTLSFGREDHCQKHIRRCHPGKPKKYESKLMKYKTEITGLVKQCFGEMKGNDAKSKDKMSLVVVNLEQLPKHRLASRNVSMSDDSSKTSRMVLRHSAKPEKLDKSENPSVSSCSSEKVPFQKADVETSDVCSLVTSSRNSMTVESSVSKKSEPGKLKHGINKPTDQSGRIYCQECKVDISLASRLSHIFKFHMQTSMYFCNYCEYETVEKGNCYRHIQQNHPGSQLKIVDKTDECVAEIESWKHRCFPSKGFVKVMCQECKVTMWYTHKLRHILQKHIGINMYFCSYCGQGSMDKSNCSKHVTAVHSNNPTCRVVDKTGEHSSEIESWKSQCFLEGQNTKGKGRRKEAAMQLEYNPNESSTDSVDGSSGTLPPAHTSRRLPRSELPECTACKKTLTSQGDIDGHILQEHIKQPVFLCSYCEYSNFGYKLEIIQHVQEKHPTEEPKFRNELEQHRAELDAFRIINIKTAGKPVTAGNSAELKGAQVKTSGASGSGRLQACQLCHGTEVRTELWLRHILAYHLKKRVYLCGYCNYGTNCQPTNIRGHIRKAHPSKAINIRDLTDTEPFRSEIQDWKRRCFVVQGSEWQNGNDSRDSASGLFNSLTRPLLEESQSGKIEVKKEGKAKVKMGFRCSLCPKDTARYQWMDTKNLREQHVLLTHFRKKLYSCSLCAFRDCSKKGNVRKHIAKCHPGQEVEIGSQYQLYKEEIHKMMTECFAKRRKRITNNALNALNVLKDFAKQKKDVSEGKEENRLCKECKREISLENMEKHIFEVHLKEKCVGCPYCDFAVFYDPEQIKFHIPVFHSENEVQVKDGRAQLREKFEKFKKNLFE